MNALDEKVNKREIEQNSSGDVIGKTEQILASMGGTVKGAKAAGSQIDLNSNALMQLERLGAAVLARNNK
jgi:hypothetical protein